MPAHRSNSSSSLTPADIEARQHAINMTDSLSKGQIPHNAELHHILDTTKQALQRTQARGVLSPTGQSTARDAQRWVDALQTVINEKNPDEAMQRAAFSAAKAAEAASLDPRARAAANMAGTIDGRAALASVTRGLNNMVSPAERDYFRSVASNLVRQLMTSGDLRASLEKLSMLLLDIFSNRASLGQMAGQSRMTFLTGDLTPQELQSIGFRAQELFLSISRQPQTRAAILSLFDLYDELKPRFAQAASGLKRTVETASEVTHSAAGVPQGAVTSQQLTAEAYAASARRDAQVLLERFAGGYSLRPLWHALKELSGALEADAALHTAIPGARNDTSIGDSLSLTRRFIEASVTDPAWTDSPVWLDDFSEYVRQQRVLLRPYSGPLQRALTEMNGFVNAIKTDPATRELAVSSELLLQNLFLDPVTGRATFKPEALLEVRKLVVPVIMQLLNWVALPRIETDPNDPDSNMDFAVEGIVFRGSEVLPEQIIVENNTQAVLDTSFDGSGERDAIQSRVYLAVKDIRAQLEGIKFKYARHKFPKLHDEGTLDLELGGDGMRIEVYLDINTDDIEANRARNLGAPDNRALPSGTWKSGPTHHGRRSIGSPRRGATSPRTTAPGDWVDDPLSPRYTYRQGVDVLSHVPHRSPRHVGVTATNHPLSDNPPASPLSPRRRISRRVGGLMSPSSPEPNAYLTSPPGSLRSSDPATLTAGDYYHRAASSRVVGSSIGTATEGGHFMRARLVRCTIDSLRIRNMRGVEHRALYAMAKPVLNSVVKRRLAESIEEAIVKAIAKLDLTLVKLQHKVAERKLEMYDQIHANEQRNAVGLAMGGTEAAVERRRALEQAPSPRRGGRYATGADIERELGRQWAGGEAAMVGSPPIGHLHALPVSPGGRLSRQFSNASIRSGALSPTVTERQVNYRTVTNAKTGRPERERVETITTTMVEQVPSPTGAQRTFIPASNSASMRLRRSSEDFFAYERDGLSPRPRARMATPAPAMAMAAPVAAKPAPFVAAGDAAAPMSDTCCVQEVFRSPSGNQVVETVTCSSIGHAHGPNCLTAKTAAGGLARAPIAPAPIGSSTTTTTTTTTSFSPRTVASGSFSPRAAPVAGASPPMSPRTLERNRAISESTGQLINTDYMDPLNYESMATVSYITSPSNPSSPVQHRASHFPPRSSMAAGGRKSAAFSGQQEARLMHSVRTDEPAMLGQDSFVTSYAEYKDSQIKKKSSRATGGGGGKSAAWGAPEPLAAPRHFADEASLPSQSYQDYAAEAYSSSSPSAGRWAGRSAGAGIPAPPPPLPQAYSGSGGRAASLAGGKDMSYDSPASSIPGKKMTGRQMQERSQKLYESQMRRQQQTFDSGSGGFAAKNAGSSASAAAPSNGYTRNLSPSTANYSAMNTPESTEQFSSQAPKARTAGGAAPSSLSAQQTGSSSATSAQAPRTMTYAEAASSSKNINKPQQQQQQQAFGNSAARNNNTSGGGQTFVTEESSDNYRASRFSNGTIDNEIDELKAGTGARRTGAAPAAAAAGLFAGGQGAMSNALGAVTAGSIPGGSLGAAAARSTLGSTAMAGGQTAMGNALGTAGLPAQMLGSTAPRAVQATAGSLMSGGNAGSAAMAGGQVVMNDAIGAATSNLPGALGTAARGFSSAPGQMLGSMAAKNTAGGAAATSAMSGTAAKTAALDTMAQGAGQGLTSGLDQHASNVASSAAGSATRGLFK
ncbi:hypothetical protein H696_00579 [Fonticula alba]|uniref:Uncharacterized protein n=1 Tax=Fonticula alba TaxID=691883 RepID=A0A058ZF69_FONAL|nr:hypothetical protein H696_00579 [Fonticula alba]KCV73030.1 hypothetical protein H696_00579 [Fonticula alba]|eukprot:XP_009492731.1 hypothetical protein H696_00579 [Fonticula alba]